MPHGGGPADVITVKFTLRLSIRIELKGGIAELLKSRTFWIVAPPGIVDVGHKEHSPIVAGFYEPVEILHGAPLFIRRQMIWILLVESSMQVA